MEMNKILLLLDCRKFISKTKIGLLWMNLRQPSCFIQSNYSKILWRIWINSIVPINYVPAATQMDSKIIHLATIELNKLFDFFSLNLNQNWSNLLNLLIRWFVFIALTFINFCEIWLADFQLIWFVNWFMFN